MLKTKLIIIIPLLILALITIFGSANALPGNITLPIEVRNSVNTLVASKEVGVNITFFDQLTGGNPHFAHGTILATTDSTGRIFPQFDISALNGNATYFMEISIDNVTTTPRVLLSPSLYAYNARRVINQTIETGLVAGPANFSGGVNITAATNADSEAFAIRNRTGTTLLQILTGNQGLASFSILANAINITLLNNTLAGSPAPLGLFQVRDAAARIIFQVNASGHHGTPYIEIAVGMLNLSSRQPLYISGNLTHNIGGNLIINGTGGVNASAVGFGTLPAGVLPNPAASTLGGVNSITCSGTNKLSAIGTDGLPVCSADQSGGVDVQTFTTIGANTWTKPSSGTVVRVQMWAGGGSGGRGGSADAGGGGGGGGYVEFARPITDFAATETCNVGAGGAAVTADETDGKVGGPTNITINGVYNGYSVYGGGGGEGATAADGGGGGGGGLWGPGVTGTGDGATGGAGGIGCGTAAAGVVEKLFGDMCGGGGGDNAGDGGWATWGGGGGGGGQDNGVAYAGGNSSWGGGGGGGGDGAAAPEGSGGGSKFGGAGGKGSTNAAAATAGSQPGGGGGGSELANSGAGGDGKCIVTVW